VKDNRVKGIIYASITTFLWGFLAIALKMGTNVIDPMTIVWFRFFVAFAILFIYFSIAKSAYLKIMLKPPLLLAVAAIGLGLNYVGFLNGVDKTTPSTAQVLIQLGPILLGLVGVVILKERVSFRQGLGFLVAGLGLFLFYRDNIAKMIGQEDAFNTGVLWVLVAAVAWVLYAALQKVLVKSYPAQQLNLVIFGIPALLFLPFADFDALFELSPGNWLLMVYLGANTLIAYACLAVAFKYLEANKVGIIITLNPIFTFVFMGLITWLEIKWISFEEFTIMSLVAALLVVSGAILAVAFTRKQGGKSKR
jgi:drug/metabolite transporter (DMT)-like permease